MAETYHVLDWRKLPLRLVATLAGGLRENSRIRMKLSNSPVNTLEALTAGILDSLRVLAWQKTEDGIKGRNFPPSVLDSLLGKNKNESPDSFETEEEFKAEWKKRTKGGIKNGRT